MSTVPPGYIPEEEWLTPKEFAAAVGKHLDTVYGWIRSGAFRHGDVCRLGGEYRIRLGAEVDTRHRKSPEIV
jgi:hypothetical protein